MDYDINLDSAFLIAILKCNDEHAALKAITDLRKISSAENAKEYMMNFIKENYLSLERSPVTSQGEYFYKQLY